MEAIGEHSLPWFAAEKASAETDLTALVNLHSALLYRIALSILRNPAEAEDVVQDVFLRVLERQPKLSDVVAIKPWLIRIAWNLAIDRRRKVRPDQMDDLFAASLVSASLPADEAVAQGHHFRKVLHAIENLPQRERQALLLSAMDELTTPEIGAIIGKSESTVRSLLFRARKRLRYRLQE
jgi:RNA polymerase sigma-70 factor (ECF subfamily)